MIKPTIGRIVLFRPKDPSYDESKRFTAIVANVNEDGTVHLGVFNHYGVNESEQNVTLVQDDEVPQRGQCELELPPLALKTPAEEIPDNVTDIDHASGITDFDEDAGSGSTSGPESGSVGDEDTTAEQDVEQGMKVDEEVTESAALMGLKAHAGEVDILGARFLDAEGNVISEGTDGCVLVSAVFVDDVEYTVTFDEWNTIDEGALKFRESEVS